MTVIDAKVLEERRRRMRENGRLMDAMSPKLQADREAHKQLKFVARMGGNPDDPDMEPEIDYDDIPVDGVPHPDDVADQRAGLPKSALLTWFRSNPGMMSYHSFKLAYPVGLSDEAKARIPLALSAMGWDERWQAWMYMGEAAEEEIYGPLETMLKMEVEKVFHRGDVPDMLSGHVMLRWSERKSDSNDIHCSVSGLDKLTPEKRQQFMSTVESHDGFLNGTSLTFPQIHSGEIVDSLKMAGFHVGQTYPREEPHFIEISENAPIWVSGALGSEDWIFITKGDFWEVRIGGSNPELFPRWRYGGRQGNTTFSAASLEFWQAEQHIGLAVQHYLGGHPEKPLDGGVE